ncbi:MAG: asparagine synthase (glutamine-hydrolyzing) [Acidobacteriota bacterium]
MCGITGWVDWEQDLSLQKDILQRMTQTMVHRGPDASGYWLSCEAALGHRRLVVVDPVGGAQPMTRRCGDQQVTITYNGELYNTLDLRRELQALGFSFATKNSDTETLLVSYLAWGPACVEKLNGIFAFAIWDEQKKRLFMARDRMGVKPLFYAQRGKSFLFGSELKALLAHPLIKPEVNAEGLAEIFVMGPSRTPGHGIFAGIYELRPGCCLIYNQTGIKTWQYWHLRSKEHEDDLETTTQRVRELLEDTVSRQLVSDVPVSTFLSGGLDSSAITAMAARTFKENGFEPLRTFSVDYHDNDQYFEASRFQPDSDSLWVGRVSEYLGTAHRSIVHCNNELAEALIPSLFANDLPGMADIDSSLHLFCREVKKEVTVALSGECADEVFGGYPWFISHKSLQGSSFPWIRAVDERAQMLNPEVRDIIRPVQYAGDRYHQALSEVPVLPGENEWNARIREIFYINLTRFMPTLLDRKDRMSMARGLEVRVPFSDHRLVEYVWNIPWELKEYGGMVKGILRKALSGVLPDDVLYRRKSPYPKTHSPVYREAVQSHLNSILDAPASPLHDFINTAKLRETIKTGRQLFTEPFFGQLMGDPQYMAFLIQFDTWMREYRVVVK